LNLWSKLVASYITESKFIFTGQTDYICSKQYENQSEYYCDAIKRSFEEKPLFEFPIVTLIASLKHKTYSELQNLGFSAKQRTTDAWTLQRSPHSIMLFMIFNQAVLSL
jgi:hypothetical protein